MCACPSAFAGTHNHRPSCCARFSTCRLDREDNAVWVPAFAGRRERSPLLRRNIPKLRRMRRDIFETVLRCTRLSDGSRFATRHSGPPLRRRPDRPRHKTAAAVRADITRACSRRSPHRTCTHNCRCALPWNSAAGPCRNIRSSVEVAAPWCSVCLEGQMIANRAPDANAEFPRFPAMSFVIPGRAKHEPGIHTPDRVMDFGLARFTRAPE